MRAYTLRLSVLLVFVCFIKAAYCQLAPPPGQSSRGASATAPPASQLAQKPGSQLITLDQAIQMALDHNHYLLAARTTVQQSQADEITANLRPNPVLVTDSIFLPVFQPSNFSSDYIDNIAQWDMGASYLFERGKKRQHRLEAARDQTAVTRAQVSDAERSLAYGVATQFLNVELAESALELSNQNLKNFQDTLDITQSRYKAGGIGLDDLLKMKLQYLQFQTDVAQAKLARAQGLSDLRQMLGYESVNENYDVAGSFEYVPMHSGLEDLQLTALKSRPDLQAAQLGVKAANSQFELQKANGKQDVTGEMTYTHLAYLNDLSFYAQVPLPIFNRNQGEIKRSRFAITQAQEQQLYTNGQVLTDVRDAYEGWQATNEIVDLYRNGYLDDAQQSRDITDYAYRRGAASLLDFLDAERSYRATQLGYRQALASYLLSLEQLREAVGTRSLP